MEFSKDELETKKYQDLVKLAKEHDVYRRYAPKAEIIDRLLELNKEPETAEDYISDVSMPSLPEVTDDESEPENVPVRKMSKEAKSEARPLRSKSGVFQISQKVNNELPAGNVPAEDRRLTFEVPYERSVLSELTLRNADSAKPESIRRTRRTIAFMTPEHPKTPAIRSEAAERKSKEIRLRRTTFATPYRQLVKTPAKSAMKPGTAHSTPAPSKKSPSRNKSSDKLRTTFTADDSDVSHPKSSGDSDDDTPTIKREGTYEIISVNDSNNEVSHIVMAKTPSSPFNDSQWNSRTRSGRNTSTPVADLHSTDLEEGSNTSRKSVKELCSLFEPQDEEAATGNRSMKRFTRSPALLQPSTSRVSFASPMTSTRRSSGPNDSRLNASSKLVVPSTGKKAYVTNRARVVGCIKPPSTKKLSFVKGTPKVTVRSPSVAKEIEEKQKIVSAKKQMESMSGTKSKIPPPRRVPNFSEMHAKMYSKMDSLVDVKAKIQNRAMELNNANIPRCASTPKFFSGKKESQPERAADVRPNARPVAVRKLLSPKVSKIPKLAVPSPVAVRPLPASPKRSLKKDAAKPQPARKLMPPNATISRLPLVKTGVEKGTSAWIPGASSVTEIKSGNESQRRKVETIVQKAPVRKVQDITGKNRQLLQSVRVNKRFELQMKHRMNSMRQ